MKIKHIYIFLVIFLIGLVLRFFLLSKFPPSLTIDEINNGYTAFSLLKTGKDEWGVKLPVIFRSIGDYKPPVLIYFTVPSVFLFGLNEFSTRFPVALFSLFALPIFYFLSKKYLLKDHPIWVSLLATFFLSTSAWNIVYARSDFEAVMALTFVLINITFLYRYVTKGSLIDLSLAVFFAFLSAVTYHSNKLFVPLLDLTLVALNRSSFQKHVIDNYNKKKLIFLLLTILFVGISIFFLKNYVFGLGAHRAQMVFFSLDFEFERALMDGIRYVGLTMIRLPLLCVFWLKRYLEYFSPNFYLYSGLELTQTNTPGVGVLSLALYPFFVIGLFLLFFVKNNHLVNGKNKVFILAWLLLGFLPASLANNPQQPLRSLNSSVAVIVISVIGLYQLFNLIKDKYLKFIPVFIILFSILYIFDFARFVDYYLVHYPYELSEYRQYGWKQMAQFVYPIHNNYDNVYVDPRFGTIGRNTYGVPHLYFLFYSQYDPAKYQNGTGRQDHATDFENIHFTEIDWSSINKKGNNLYIASPWSFPDIILTDRYIIHEEKFLNQQVGLYAVQNIPKK